VELLLTLAYTAIFVFLIGKLKFFDLDGISLNTIKIAYLLKIAAGISVGLIYTYYYTDRLTADTFKFFDDSKILFDAVYSQPFDFLRMVSGIGAGAAELQPYYDKMTNWYDTFSPYNDNRTLIRLNAFLRIFSLGNYYVHVVFVCFLSLTGIIAVVKVFSREFPLKSLEIFAVFLLLPSVLFWGSGLLKDSLVIFSLGLVLYWFDKFLYSGQVKINQLVLLILSLFLLLISKFHVFVLILPLLTAWWICAKTGYKPYWVFISSTISFFMLIVLISFLAPNWNMAARLAQKQQAFFNLATETTAGSFISIPVLEPNFISFILNAPAGFLFCLTRPFITDGGSVLILISAIENLLILLFCVYALFKFRFKLIQNKIMPWLCIFYTITFFVLIGVVTPVLGAIVRYKAQALPFLVVFFLIASNTTFHKNVIKLFSKNNS